MIVMSTADSVYLEKVPNSQRNRSLVGLKFLPFQTNLFDNVSTSDSDSDLSGPFEDVVYSKEFESKKKAKQLYGKNLYSAFSFSSKFKSAMEDVKKEKMRDDSHDAVTQNDAVSENSERTYEPKSYTDRKVDFNFPEFPDVDYGEEIEVEEKKKEKNGTADKKKSGKVSSDEDEFFDTMSGYWRLLSVFDEFRISPPWYDAYAEGKEHWLQTKPVPREVFENSRIKCLNWLKNYFKK